MDYITVITTRARISCYAHPYSEQLQASNQTLVQGTEAGCTPAKRLTAISHLRVHPYPDIM